MEKEIKICELSAFSEKAQGFDPFNSGHDTLFLVRDKDQIVAYQDVCPHFGETTLPWKKDAYLDATGEHIVCSAHGALFDISTGRCLQGPCAGKNLTPIPIEVRNGEEIWLLSKTDEETIR